MLRLFVLVNTTTTVRVDKPRLTEIIQSGPRAGDRLSAHPVLCLSPAKKLVEAERINQSPAVPKRSLRRKLTGNMTSCTSDYFSLWLMLGHQRDNRLEG
jgi:hypothetical protein